MKDINSLVKENLEETKKFLVELIRYPSVSGEEEEAVQRYIAQKLSSFGKVEMKEVPDSLKQHADYTFGDKEFDYSKKKNVVLHWPSRGEGKSLILNSHSDVVGAENWPDAFSPKIEGDTIIGRGACDAKGQIATMYLVLLVLKQMGVNLLGDLTVQSVVEEEVGGNGSLALIQQGHKADGVIILEPTALMVAAGNRGAIWWRLEVEGKSVHMGKIWEGVNAIEKTCFLIKKLREYEKVLIEESKNVPLFEHYKQPVQMNFGVIRGEGWPSMVCGKVVLEGGVGFLPNKTMSQVKKDLADVIKNCGDEWVQKYASFSFPKLHNDAFAMQRDHPLVKLVEESVKASSLTPEVAGWIVSCDARLFSKTGGMPVVVFGAGDLKDAHSAHEQVNLQDIAAAAETIVRAVINWCGTD